MTDVSEALYGFFSGFGIPAYSKNNVPWGAAMPYVTYEVVRPAPLSRAIFHAWVWYRGNGFAPLTAKVDQIEAALGRGVSIPVGNGFIAIFPERGTPFAQEQPDPDRDVRVMCLTMALHANTE